MIKIEFTSDINDEDIKSDEDLAERLRFIAQMIENGFTSGYYPNWELTKNVRFDDE